jgi:WD40 repeat protein
MSLWNKLIGGGSKPGETAKRTNSIPMATAAERAGIQGVDVSPRHVRNFEGHTNKVTAVAYSPNGDYVLSASDDGIVRQWEIKSGESLRGLACHARVYAAALSPTGKWAMVGDDDGAVFLWDLTSGGSNQIRNRRPSVAAVAFSPDGRHALVGALNEFPELWDVTQGTVLRYFEGHRGWVVATAFAPDGKTALSGSHDKTLRVWDVKSGKCLRTLEGHTDAVKCVLSVRLRRSLVTLFLAEIGRSRVRRTVGHFQF